MLEFVLETKKRSSDYMSWRTSLTSFVEIFIPIEKDWRENVVLNLYNYNIRLTLLLSMKRS